ncbi:FBP domain-containing protein [uncultured Leifsonia sp.]|uniref:FBP domain-containing protein n=1 Tax=uncultured Leifsonia sp. TaxID=340359 RepID=UPI0025DF7367|nr:FBP domain-containing protein [uncultured Leifsonia sp.]
MLPLTDARIRASFVNASQRERKELTLPDLDAQRWDDLDFLGWRDRKNPNLGYVVAEVDGEPVGVLLRKAEGGVRSRPQCSWCEDVHLPNEVVFFIAKRAGAAGRKGDTLGTLVCAEFQCSANVRKRAPLAYVGFDVEAARQHRIDALREHVDTFVRRVIAP